MILIRCFSVFLLLLVSGVAWAQCPYGIPNNPGCVPPDAWPQNQQGTVPASPRQPTWVYTWGAIAQGVGVAGVSTGKNNKRQAEKAAIKDCRDGGGGKQCKVVVSYYHQCVAYATGNKMSRASTGPDEEEMQIRALRECKELNDGEECKIIYANCTEPYQVR